MSSKKQSSGKVSPPKVKYVDGPTYASSYCNNVAYAINPTDLVLIFGEVIDATRDEAIVERRARITMAPTQGKMLLLILEQQINMYERVHGSIALPAGFEEKLAENAR